MDSSSLHCAPKKALTALFVCIFTCTYSMRDTQTDGVRWYMQKRDQVIKEHEQRIRDLHSSIAKESANIKESFVKKEIDSKHASRCIQALHQNLKQRVDGCFGDIAQLDNTDKTLLYQQCYHRDLYNVIQNSPKLSKKQKNEVYHLFRNHGARLVHIKKNAKAANDALDAVANDITDNKN